PVYIIRTNCAWGTPLIQRIPSSATKPASFAASIVSLPTKFPIVARRSWDTNRSSVTTSPSENWPTSILNLPSRNVLPIRSASAAATRVSFPWWYTFIRMGIGGSRLQPFDELILVFRGAVNLAFLGPAFQPSVHLRGRDATLLR